MCQGIAKFKVADKVSDYADKNKRNQDMGGDKMSHSPYLDSCNMIEKSFFSDKAPIYNNKV